MIRLAMLYGTLRNRRACRWHSRHCAFNKQKEKLSDKTIKLFKGESDYGTLRKEKQ